MSSVIVQSLRRQHLYYRMSLFSKFLKTILEWAFGEQLLTAENYDKFLEVSNCASLLPFRSMRLSSLCLFQRRKSSKTTINIMLFSARPDRRARPTPLWRRRRRTLAATPSSRLTTRSNTFPSSTVLTPSSATIHPASSIRWKRGGGFAGKKERRSVLPRLLSRTSPSCSWPRSIAWRWTQVCFATTSTSLGLCWTVWNSAWPKSFPSTSPGEPATGTNRTNLLCVLSPCAVSLLCVFLVVWKIKPNHWNSQTLTLCQSFHN